MTLGGFFSYKPPGASSTAQGPQEQPEIIKKRLYICSATKHKKSVFLDLDIGFHTFEAGSREEISRRIRI